MASMSVLLNCSDIKRSLDFYKTLGFKETYVGRAGDHVAYADLELEGTDLSLSSIDMNEDPDFRKWVSTPLGAGVVVYLMIEDVDRFHEPAKKAGAVIEEPPQTRFYGRVFTINDPDGYTVTFLDETKAAKAE